MKIRLTSKKQNEKKKPSGGMIQVEVQDDGNSTLPLNIFSLLLCFSLSFLFTFFVSFLFYSLSLSPRQCHKQKLNEWEAQHCSYIALTPSFTPLVEHARRCAATPSRPRFSLPFTASKRRTTATTPLSPLFCSSIRVVLIVALLVCLLSRKERGTPHMFIVDVVSRFGCRARSSRGAIVRLGCGAIGQAGSWSCRRAGSRNNGQAKSGPGSSVGQLLTREERAYSHTVTTTRTTCLFSSVRSPW